MYNRLQDLQITRIVPRKDGIFAYAKYPHWWTEFSFLIEPGGVVKGKTSSGLWLEVSGELGTLIYERVQVTLRENPQRIYA